MGFSILVKKFEDLKITENNLNKKIKREENIINQAEKKFKNNLLKNINITKINIKSIDINQRRKNSINNFFIPKQEKKFKKFNNHKHNKIEHKKNLLIQKNTEFFYCFKNNNYNWMHDIPNYSNKLSENTCWHHSYSKIKNEKIFVNLSCLKYENNKKELDIMNERKKNIIKVENNLKKKLKRRCKSNPLKRNTSVNFIKTINNLNKIKDVTSKFNIKSSYNLFNFKIRMPSIININENKDYKLQESELLKEIQLIKSNKKIFQNQDFIFMLINNSKNKYNDKFSVSLLNNNLIKFFNIIRNKLHFEVIDINNNLCYNFILNYKNKKIYLNKNNRAIILSLYDILIGIEKNFGWLIVNVLDQFNKEIYISKFLNLENPYTFNVNKIKIQIFGFYNNLLRNKYNNFLKLYKILIELNNKKEIKINFKNYIK